MKDIVFTRRRKTLPLIKMKVFYNALIIDIKNHFGFR